MGAIRQATPARTGVWVGIATISMSFAAYTSAMVARQGAAPDWLHFQLPPILYFNTMVLLASSGTLELSRRRIVDAAGRYWLGVTLALGMVFVTGQVLAWRDLAAQGLYLGTSPSSAFVYVFTVLHALHLLGGIVALVYVLWRLRRLSGPRPTGALGAVALYWHFMDALWLYLLLVLTIRL
jgi:cytochrome c oxidase subunit 3